MTALLNSQHGASTAAFIDGTTQNRGRLLEAYRLGLIKVLVCYAVLTEGVDLPMTETVLLARPVATTNVGLYAQMVGRGLRLHPGKVPARLLIAWHFQDADMHGSNANRRGTASSQT